MGIRLSPSTIGDFKDCPRCFWLDKNQGIKKPRGIFPSLPGGMDRVIKERFDAHRMVGKLPHELAELKGSLFADMGKLTSWRNWRTGMRCMVDGIEVSGAVDDCFIEADSLASPLDYKTRGAAPKADAPDYYGHQLDIYALLFAMNGLAVSGRAYLVYYWQNEAMDFKDSSVMFQFNSVVEKKEANIERAAELVRKAAECLNGPVPGHSDKCEYGPYLASMASVKVPA